MRIHLSGFFLCLVAWVEFIAFCLKTCKYWIGSCNRWWYPALFGLLVVFAYTEGKWKMLLISWYHFTINVFVSIIFINMILKKTSIKKNFFHWKYSFSNIIQPLSDAFYTAENLLIFLMIHKYIYIFFIYFTNISKLYITNITCQIRHRCTYSRDLSILLTNIPNRKMLNQNLTQEQDNTW